jgi:acetyltransferase-like isoleucine patch superfamily enzyme
MLGKYLSLSQLSRLNFKKIGKNVLIDKNVIIPNPTNIEIGNNVRIDTMCILSSGKNGSIIIKNNVHIAPFNLLYCAENYKVVFENHSGLSAGCKLYGKTNYYDGNYLINPTHTPEDAPTIGGDIILNKFAQIGADSILFPGSIIPIGTVLGAKSLYTAKYSLDEWSVYAGIPVKLIKSRSKRCQLLSAKYEEENI